MESKNNYLNFLNKKKFKLYNNRISQEFNSEEILMPLYAPKPIPLLLPLIFRSSPKLESRTGESESPNRWSNNEARSPESRTSPEFEYEYEYENERLIPIIKSNTVSPFLDNIIIDKNIEKIDNFYKFSNGKFIWFQNNPIYVVPTEYFLNGFQISIFYLLNKQFQKTYGYIINGGFVEYFLKSDTNQYQM